MFEFIVNNIITSISIGIIFIVFIWFLYEASKMYKVYTKIEKAINSNDILKYFKQTKLSSLQTAYEQTINIVTPEGAKTNIPSSDFFNDSYVCKVQGLNLRILDTAAGTLVGLGLLGTFLGLTIGVSNFDSSNSDNIQKSIQLLLSGMATAFMTSLIGMSCSLIYTFFDKYWRHRLSKYLQTMTDKLDNMYYIDDVTLATRNQQEMFNGLYTNVKDILEINNSNLIKELQSKLTYSNSEGQCVTVANVIREILTENAEQTKALKSFSTDLALELNNGFDEVLSRQMQQKILPLMENVDITTKSIVEHIDKMAEQVSSPATEMIQSVVDELKNSMTSIIKEFNTGLSGSATNELENLASQLGTAAQAMADFPNNMENISATLQVTIEEVKSAVSEISNTSANANSTAMQQMQEQISFATGAISNAISEVKDVMGSITQSSQQQSNEMANKLADAAEKMGTFLNGTITKLSSSVQESIENITADVNNKQADLISLQEDTTAQTRKLLETFNIGLERLEKMNEYISGTMNMFQQAQGQISGSTAHLQTITGDMKLATQLFNRSQVEYSTKMEEMQRNSQRGIDSLATLLSNTGEMSQDYVEKFEIIKQGLGSIFAQLQQGLSEYSRTVQTTTQRYLDQYSTSLTNTTDALSSTIQQQNEVVEMLVESLNSHKR
ncbi:MAG: MotA/TolQ/ExbB proton channel family protein [Prevotella sp.]|nr:MotA/TolQ/ExbB proton channel family protein [Prevotella sp.]